MMEHSSGSMNLYNTYYVKKQIIVFQRSWLYYIPAHEFRLLGQRSIVTICFG